MSFRRMSWALAGLVCACERAHTRLERVSQKIEVKAADEDLERGRAALQQLKAKTIAPPPGRTDAEVVRVVLTVTAADGELDPASKTSVESRVPLLRLGGMLDSSAARIEVTLPEAPRERVPAIAAALAGQGRLQIAHLESQRRREDVRVGDPAIRWTPLQVERVALERSPLAGVRLSLRPESGAALTQATSRGGYLALAFDDLVLSVPRIDSPVSGGELTLGDHAEELGDPRGSVGVLAAVLAAPAPESLHVEVTNSEPAVACADPASCQFACTNGSGRACMRVAASLDESPRQIEAWLAACASGANDGCTLLCAHGTTEQCMAGIETLYDVRSVWSDPRHAAALAVGLCRKGDLAACSSAMAALLIGPLGPDEYATADAMLKGIRDEALLVQATAMRQLVLDRAREECREDVTPETGAKACLFVAQAHAGGVLAPRDPAKEEEALRRAGKFLRELPAKP